MADFNFVIDESKCIHCGLCAKDCIAAVISMEGDTPKATAPQRCIGCQHCLAICPVGAISIMGKNPDDSDKIYAQNPDMILNLIKSRRSDRQYKQENVDADKLNKLKDMLAWVPTGCNCRKLHFSFIDDIDVMNEFREYTNKKIISALEKNPIKAVAERFSNYAKLLLKGEDVIFRGAPHMVVVANHVDAPCSKEDAIIALSYFELYAQSLGIGTCWCGLGDSCMKLFPELCEYMGIPEGYKPEYSMLFGPKEVNYSRTTQPEKVSVVSAKKTGFEKLSAGKAAKRYFWNFLR
ncbi:MAG: nitroreductase family protein [Candidatus Gastranaerophilales bacterium]|nr:nitroreductase family protein [Candidatus Gastranaerophilales bacterium]